MRMNDEGFVDISKVHPVVEPDAEKTYEVKFGTKGITASGFGDDRTFFPWDGLKLNAEKLRRAGKLTGSEITAENDKRYKGEKNENIGKMGIPLDADGLKLVLDAIVAYRESSPRPKRDRRTGGPKPQTLLANQLVMTHGLLDDLKAQSAAHNWGVDFKNLDKELAAIDIEAQPLTIGPVNAEAIEASKKRLTAFDEAVRKFQEEDILEARIDNTDKWLKKVEADGVLGIVTGSLRASLTDLLAAIDAGISYRDADAKLRKINADLGNISPASKMEATRSKPNIRGRGGNREDRGQPRRPVSGGATLGQVASTHANQRDSRRQP